jgi:hypothetical protein
MNSENNLSSESLIQKKKKEDLHVDDDKNLILRNNYDESNSH